MAEDFDYIEDIDSRTRRHDHLGGVGPGVF